MQKNKMKGIQPDALLGELYIKQGKFAEAIDQLQSALNINPEDVFVNYLMGLALDGSGKKTQAITFYQKLVDLGNQEPTLHNRLGSLYLEMSCYLRAYQYLSPLVQIMEDNANLHAQLALINYKLGYSLRAKYHCLKAHKLDPQSKEYLLTIIFLCHKDLSLKPKDITNNTKIFYEQFLANNEIPPDHQSRLDSTKTKFKIGFVSADFYRHPIAYYLIPVLENLNQEQFEIFLYYNGDKQDKYTEMLMQNCQKFSFIKALDDKKAAELITAGGIDILVDLSGLTHGERLGVFALKPAPLQISQMGYFGTLAMSEMDYVLADREMLTQEEERCFIEKVYKMEGFYSHCAIPDLPQAIDEIPYMKNGFITFGSLNTLHKISEEVIQTWSQILNQVPDSRILLDAVVLQEPATREHFLSKFYEQGIDPSRVIVQSTIDRQEFLRNYNNIDIALDPFPYGGATTSMEALLMGVPVITQEGDRWISRFTYSILKNLGLDELIANDLDTYINKAITLAANIDQLKEYRFSLKTKITNSSFNIQSYTKKYAQSLQDMWLSKCKHPELELNWCAQKFETIKEPAKALELYLQSIQHNPNQANIYNQIGIILSKDAQHIDALACGYKALALDPSNAYINACVGDASARFGMHAAAVKHYGLAHELEPKLKNYLSSLIFVKHKDSATTLPELLTLSKKYNELYLSHIQPLNIHFDYDISKTKLKLGIISGDLNRHPVAFYLLGLLEHLNRERFEVHLYYSNSKQDSMTDKFKELGDSFTFISEISNLDTAQLIAQVGIDVLFDCSGYTKGERLEILKYKSAPVQVSHVGYFGTLAIPELDFIFANPYVVKKEEEKYYTEKIYMLPSAQTHCALPQMPESLTEAPSIKNGYITFGSMNSYHKLSEDLFKIWIKILKQVPGSKIIFDTQDLISKGPTNYLYKLFQNHGIENSRLIIRSTKDRFNFLETYNDIDIALDPFPYGGSTTTIESLHMGVPVVTREGNGWTSRFSSSILQTMKHEELITNNWDDYISKAVELAKDKDRLNQYRKELKTDMLASDLNINKHVALFEKAVRDMWEVKCQEKNTPSIIQILESYFSDNNCEVLVQDLRSQGIEAACFDLDGTLVDTESINLEIVKQSLIEYGVELNPEEEQQFAGTPIRDFVKKILECREINDADQKSQSIADYKESIFPELLKAGQIHLFNRVVDLLKVLHKYNFKLALVTSSKSKVMELVLNHFKLTDLFNVKLGREDANGHLKPNPFIYKKAFQSLGLAEYPEKIIVFEDSAPGVNSAFSANAHTIVLKNSEGKFPAKLPRADKIYHLNMMKFYGK